MEDIKSIILPDLSDKKNKKTPKPAKTVLVEKQELKRVNRTVKCIYCENDKILNPDQYQNLFDMYGSEEKVQEEFCCKQCEVVMRKNPFLFWSRYGEPLHDLIKSIKPVVNAFASSSKNLDAARSLQIGCLEVLKQHKVSPDNIEFISDTNLVPTVLKIKNMPFVGEIALFLNESRSNSILING
jgi:hypothetical protein